MKFFDLLSLLGLILITIGVWMIYIPAAFIVMGLFLTVLGFSVAGIVNNQTKDTK